MKSEEAKTGGEMTVPGQTTGAEEAAEHTDVNLVVSDLTALPMEGKGPQAGKMSYRDQPFSGPL